MLLWLLVPLGYLAGSIPFGVLVTSLATGKDVRAQGSGNIGATNVARVAGKRLGALVLGLDALKGALPVWCGVHWAPEEAWLHVAIGTAAFLGHVFSLWLRFRGGKGVATALGVLLVLLPTAGLIGFGTWLVVLGVTRVSALGSLCGALLAIISSFALQGSRAYSLMAVGLFLAMVWTHRDNLRRLLQRREHRL